MNEPLRIGLAQTLTGDREKIMVTLTGLAVNHYVVAKVDAFVQPFYNALGVIGNEFHENPRLKAFVEMSKGLIADARQTLERLKAEDGELKV